MTQLTLLSPAKLNLFFRVLHKRPDGFHEIASLFQAISLFDRLTITLSESDSLSCDDSRIPCNQDNLIYKALACFRKMTGWDHPISVHLEKKIPIEAGLGGGSSNAATMLWGLKSLCPFPVLEEDLRRCASTFSSDAPFFFSSGTAYCEGRGEIVTSLEPLRPQQLWIAKPQQGLSTPLVFKHCVPETFANRDPKEQLQTALNGDFESFNDLEVPAFALLPSLKEFKENLLALGFSSVTMTGSGTAFFCYGTPNSIASHLQPIAYVNRSKDHWFC